MFSNPHNDIIRHHPILLRSESTPRPQVLSVEVQHKDAHYTSRRQSSKQTHTRPDTHAQEHRSAEHDSRESHTRASEIITGEQTGCVLRVDHREVDEDDLHQDKDWQR